jgi:hypothetical protein
LDFASGVKRSPIKRKSDKPRRVLVDGEIVKARQRKQAARNNTSFGYKVKQKMSSEWSFQCAMCKQPIQEFHHRKMRSQNGKGTAANCLPLCTRHHNMVHKHPDWSYRHGLLVRASADPKDVQVFSECSLKCTYDHVDPTFGHH